MKIQNGQILKNACPVCGAPGRTNTENQLLSCLIFRVDKYLNTVKVHSDSERTFRTDNNLKSVIFQPNFRTDKNYTYNPMDCPVCSARPPSRASSPLQGWLKAATPSGPERAHKVTKVPRSMTGGVKRG